MPSPRTNPSRRTFLAGLAGVAIVGVATGGAIVFNHDDTATADPAPASSASSAPASAASSPSSAATTKSTEAAGSTSAAPAITSAAPAITSAAPATTSAAPATTSKAAVASASPATTSKAAAASTYKDGKYTEAGDYDSPAGSESVTVTVTLTADVITATSATGSASSGPSSQYQEQFISGYATEVVGKDIDSVSLSRVSGSSLTSNGFNAALTKIKSDAKA